MFPLPTEHYISSFEVGLFHRNVKEDFVQLQTKEKFSPEEEMFVEKRLVKIQKRIRRMSFSSQHDLNILDKKLRRLNKYIWIHSIKLGPL